MFGYIRPFDPELRVIDHELYKGVYCGLCRSLSRRYGPLARFMLSYDFTFVALLQIGLSGRPPDLAEGRCPFSPFAKRPLLKEGPEVHFSAALAVLMIYYKLLDDLADGGFWKRLLCRCLLPLAARAHKKAAASHPEADAILADCMRRQREVEAGGDSGLDRASEPSAAALGELFALLSPDPAKRRVLRRLGYMMGRYVYCCDAVADLEEDKKSGGFNPILRGGCGPEAARSSLYLTQAEAYTAFSLLSLPQLEPLLGNVLTLGMRHTADTVLLQGVKAYEQSV